MESFEFGVELGLGGFLEVPISPKLFLTAGHCVLSEAGEYIMTPKNQTTFSPI